jgi:hypothetical protein
MSGLTGTLSHITILCLYCQVFKISPNVLQYINKYMEFKHVKYSLQSKMSCSKLSTSRVVLLPSFSGYLHLHLQDTSKLQCVEDFLEGMLGKRKFE